MDLIKKVETTEFSQRLRGYDIDEVDAFHADLVRELAQLQRALDEATEAAAQPAPRRPAPEERPVPDGRLHDPDGALQRLLVVAQRTADEAVSEAQAEGERMVADAEERSERINREADQQRRLIITEAAAEARRVAEATREPLIVEIADLETRRDALLADIEVLDVHVNDERVRLGSTLSRLQAVLDDPSGFRVTEPPELVAPTDVIIEESLVDVATAEGVIEPAEGEPDSADWADEMAIGIDESDDEVSDGLGAPDLHEEVVIGVTAGALVDEADDADQEPDWAGVESSSDEDEVADDESDPDDVDVPIETPELDDVPTASVTDLESARNEVVRTAEAQLPEPEPVASPYPDDVPTPNPDDASKSGSLPWDDESADSSGPPTEAVLIDDLLGDDDETNDRFLDELRRATENEFGADESDAAIAAFFDQDEDEEGEGKRRNRQ